MLVRHTTGQHVEGQPATMVFELGLIGKGWGAVRATGILRLDEPGVRIDLPNARHGEDDRAQLVQKCFYKGAVIAMMGIPMAVQRTEPRRRKRFVDGGVVLKPWISRRNRASVCGELFRERWVEQVRAAGPAAMVEQRRNRSDVARAQQFETFVRPRPVGRRQPVRSDAFPQDRITHRAKADRCESGDVVLPVVMARLPDLIEIDVTDAIDRALDPAPELERSLACHADCATAMRCSSFVIRPYSASACATT